MIGLLGKQGTAASLKQHCPQMTQRRCIMRSYKTLGAGLEVSDKLDKFKTRKRPSEKLSAITEDWLRHSLLLTNADKLIVGFKGGEDEDLISVSTLLLNGLYAYVLISIWRFMPQWTDTRVSMST